MPLPSGKPVKAKKIGGSLIAAYPGANPPVVWKFDLEKNHSFTLALQGEDGDWELGVTSPRGEFYAVARFLAREDADDAYKRTQRAMLCRDHNFWRVIGPIAVILIALFLLFALGENMVHHSPSKMNLTASPQSASMPAASAPPSQTREGIPQSADQVLTPPQ